MKLIRVMTHHEDPLLAAETYEKEGVIAIGFVYDSKVAKGDENEIRKYFRKKQKRTEQQVRARTSTFLKFRDEIEKGDIVIAYAGNNEVALIGEVTGKFQFNERNKAGDPEGDVCYPNQWKVNWWKEPRFFNRAFLPRQLSKWVAMPGTLRIKEYDKERFLKALEKVPAHAVITSAFEIENEKEIQNYIVKNIDQLEAGLTLIKREQGTDSGYMDFLAKDKQGNPVVIEVKMQADAKTALQTRRYMREYKREHEVADIRGIIVASDITKDCYDEVQELNEHGFSLKLIKCLKTFVFEDTP